MAAIVIGEWVVESCERKERRKKREKPKLVVETQWIHVLRNH